MSLLQRLLLLLIVHVTSRSHESQARLGQEVPEDAARIEHSEPSLCSAAFDAVYPHISVYRYKLPLISVTIMF